MTYDTDFTVPGDLLEQVRRQGLEAVPELIRILLNVAMQAHLTGMRAPGVRQWL